MRRSSGARWLPGALVLALASTLGGPLTAQESEEEREELRAEIREAGEEARAAREEARRAMADAREAMRQAREEVREVRIEIADRPRLGVGIDFDQETRFDDIGALVTAVPEDGPAAEAGIREGDVIVAVDGHRLTAPLSDAEEEEGLEDDGSPPVRRLVSLVRGHEPGDEVEVTWVRDGEESTATVELDSLRGMRSLRAPRAPRRPGEPGLRHGAPPHPPRAFRFREGFGDDLRREIRRGLAPLRWMEACGEMEGGFPPGPCVAGLRVASLNPELGSYFGTEQGVLVTDVAEDAALGLRPGDVVLRVGEREVQDLGDLARILRSYEEDEEVRLRVRRDGREIDVTGTIP